MSRSNHRRALRLLVLPLAVAALAAAQEDPASPFAASDDPFAAESPFSGEAPTGLGESPFASDASPFASQADPFVDAAPGQQTTTDNPFGNAPDPFAAGAGNPFGSPGGEPAAAPSPFGAPANPFGGTEDPFGPAGDPFASGAAADPFGSPATGAAADPFGSSDATMTADPFGGGATGGVADPFGSGAGMAADPFGGGSGAAADPFGGGTDGGTGVVPLFDAAGAFAGDTFGGSAAGAGDPTAVNPNGIAQMYAWRYERDLLWDGTPVVARKRLTIEEAEQYDAAVLAKYVEQIQQGAMPGYDGQTNPQDWAEWALFSDQLALWSEYVDNVVLAGYNQGASAWEQVQWPGAPVEEGQEGAGDAGIPQSGVEGLVAANQDQSLDEQLGGTVNPFSGFGGGQGQGTSLPASTMTDQIVAAYQVLTDELKRIEDSEEAFLNAFESRLLERNTRRLAYADWKQDREQVLEDFIAEWNRRYTGKVSIINGVRYELYRPEEAPDVFPRNTTPVVTDFELTPYDIINPEDGTLKEASRD